ncbi:hypothetical protein DL546_003765 [Coniochaeta pulveracea]|nr:hypothetical protein DL546_003765 [Coniochaeta pulveracea]
MNRLVNLTSVVKGHGFASEYDFQVALVELLESAHDYHLTYNPDLLGIFSFVYPALLDLISVSIDGKQLPKLYHQGGVTTENGTTVPGPALTKINDQDAVTFLEELNLKHSGYQDRDAQWNAQFASYSRPSGKHPIVAKSNFFHGHELTLTYEDGTKSTVRGRARVSPEVDFSKVNYGRDFYNRFCHPEATKFGLPAKQLRNGLQPPQPRKLPLQVDGEGRNWKHDELFLAPYPPAVVRDDGPGATAGFFLLDEGYEDVAVLAIPSFRPRSEDPAQYEPWVYTNDFQETVGEFLELCKESGKQKLVIDLTGNRGGKITSAYELFAQLFPGSPIFQAGNMRLQMGLLELARVVSEVSGDSLSDPTPERKKKVQKLLSGIGRQVKPGASQNLEGHTFNNIKEILAPVDLNGDRFGPYFSMRYDEPSNNFNLTGVGSQATNRTAVFEPENIVLLTDGVCGSTCSLFAYLMTYQKNISTTVIGGRPRLGPMQPIAGTEGAGMIHMQNLTDTARLAMELASPELQKVFKTDEYGNLVALAEGYAVRRGNGTVNFKNNFAPHNHTTPLQFLYHPANCRLFWTREMISDPELTWKRAVDGTWTDPEEVCVEGSRVMTGETVGKRDRVGVMEIIQNTIFGDAKTQ